jgi:hypothetical protein
MMNRDVRKDFSSWYSELKFACEYMSVLIRVSELQNHSEASHHSGYNPENHLIKTQNKLRDISPQTNYTDRATVACLRSLVPNLRIEGVAWSAQRIPTVVNFRFLDRSRHFLEAAPQ